MSEDARFEDGRERPVNLGALDTEDLQVISSLVQDAVFPLTELSWHPRTRRFALLLNRFRWELPARLQQRPERVQSVLAVDDVQRAASYGFDRSDQSLVLSLLSISFEPGEDGAGTMLLTLAGDGAIRLSVEALDVTLRDVTRPYAAPSGKVPQHDS